MNAIAPCALLPIVLGNAALYRYHRSRIPPGSLQDRREYPISLPTRLFRHFVVPLYGLYGLHLALYAFWFDRQGPSGLALLAGVALGLASLVLLHRSFVALGDHFAPCQLGLLPRERIHRGPYRYLAHPMYDANLLMVAGLAVASFAPTIAVIGLVLVLFYAFSIRDEDRALRAVPDAGGATGRPRWLHVLERTGRALLFAALASTALGALYQWAAGARDSWRYPPPGALVDVGGHRLHLSCAGEGQPAVILDAGLGDALPVWTVVQRELARRTRVCAYDSAGMGWSEPGPLPRTAGAMAAELHLLLGAAGVPGPYVLVGHSRGGLNVQAYAGSHPRDVAGLVLVDSMHPAQMARLPPERLQVFRDVLRQLRLGKALARLGIPRLLGLCPGMGPDEARPAVIARGCRPEAFDASAAGLASLLAGAQAAPGERSLGEMPLIVLARGLDEQAPIGDGARRETERTWRALQQELAGLSSRSSLRIAERSRHWIHVDQPALVVAAADELVQLARAG